MNNKIINKKELTKIIWLLSREYLYYILVLKYNKKFFNKKKIKKIISRLKTKINEYDKKINISKSNK